MERELFFSGYCRVTDNSRTVSVVLEDGILTETDCCFPNCIYAPGCPIAENIREAANE
jgi:hypothetical protein